MAGDLQRLSEMAGTAGVEVPGDIAQLESAWSRVVGPENARHTQVRALKRGRLTVATSSSVWAQSLQLMSEDIRRRLNEALGTERVREVVFRPAGWDPGAGAEAPRPLAAQRPGVAAGGASGAGRRPAPERALSAEEEEAVERVRRSAVTPELGELIARAMRAALARREEP